MWRRIAFDFLVAAWFIIVIKALIILVDLFR